MLYVAERIYPDWRTLGKLLQLTNNRMDMIEMESKGMQNDMAYHMLQAWRDEENGKV